MAANSNGKFDPITCLDIIGFQDYLKRLRKFDDIIISNLNTTVVISDKNEVNISNCKRFNDQLQNAYSYRDQAIHACLDDAKAKVSQLKEARQKNESDLIIQEELKRHQTRLKKIERELSFEQIIQDRSLKALHDRCRRYITF